MAGVGCYAGCRRPGRQGGRLEAGLQAAVVAAGAEAPGANGRAALPPRRRFTAYAFVAVVAVLFLGPQDRRDSAVGEGGGWGPAALLHAAAVVPAPLHAAPATTPCAPAPCRDHNFALNLFWAWWWPLVFISYLFLGRVWCSGEPAEAAAAARCRRARRSAIQAGETRPCTSPTPRSVPLYDLRRAGAALAPEVRRMGGWQGEPDGLAAARPASSPPPAAAPRLRLWSSQGAKLMKWPREWLDRYGYWFMFSLFAGILVWEEVW